MKTGLKIRICLPLAILMYGLVLPGQSSAQTFTTIYSLGNSTNGDNIDGSGPQAALILSDSSLYGTAVFGGGLGHGTVFKVKTDGTDFTVLHGFSGFPGNDGALPGGFVISSNTLYGQTYEGGSSPLEDGTLFKVNTDGSGYAVLHSFSARSLNYGTNEDGSRPWGTLVQADDALYGTTTYGSPQGQGTVFKASVGGSSFKTLHSFSAAFGGPFSPNNDGAGPGPLVLSNQTLYGATGSGGNLGGGTVFKLNTDGTGFEVLHSFPAIPGYPPYTNSEGASPGIPSGLLLSGDVLYGTTLFGGTSGGGTVFKLNTDGTSFAVLHAFIANSDGATPRGLILSDNSLFGTTSDGGNFGSGTVFKLSTDGTGFEVLHSFTTVSTNAPFTNADGAGPKAGVTLCGDTLYGTTTRGGSMGNGTIFSISLPSNRPQLTMIPLRGDVVLAWSTNFTRFTLQSATNVSVSPMWTTNLPAPVIANGQYVVTNPISGTQQFFRLSR